MFISSLRSLCFYSLLSTRAGALPKICRQTTKIGELCVVKLGDECTAVAKRAASFVLSGSADTRCELLKVVPRAKPQDLMPSFTFHGPYKQQKYGHRQSLGGDPGLFNCTPDRGPHQLRFLPNEQEAFSQ
jgi:hypothetical protein